MTGVIITLGAIVVGTAIALLGRSPLCTTAGASVIIVGGIAGMIYAWKELS